MVRLLIFESVYSVFNIIEKVFDNSTYIKSIKELNEFFDFLAQDFDFLLICANPDDDQLEKILSYFKNISVPPFAIILESKDKRPATMLLESGAVKLIVRNKAFEKQIEDLKIYLLSESFFSINKGVLNNPSFLIFFSLDTNYCYTSFSASHFNAMKHIWGVEIQIDQNMLDYIKNPEDREKARINFDRSLKDKEDFALIEEYGDNKLRRTFWKNHYTPLFDENQSVVGVVVSVIDVSDLKETELALKITQADLKNLVELAPDAFFRGDEFGNFIQVNKQAQELTGYTEEELLSLNMKDLFSRETIWQQDLRYDLIREGKIIRKDRILIRKDGSVIPIEMVSRQLPDKTFVSFIRDMKKQKELEVSLRESEERYIRIFEKAPIGLIEFDQNGVIRNCNEEFVKTMGSSSKALIGFNMLEKLQNQRVRQAVLDALNHKTGFFEGFYSSVTGGKASFVRGVFTGICEGDKFKSGVGIIEDISSQKEAEEALLKEKERLMITLKSIGDGVITTDTEGRVTLMNPIAENLTGYLQKDAIGRSIQEIFRLSNEQTEEFVENPVFKTIYSGEIVELSNHAQLTSKTGKIFKIADSAAPIKNSEGKILGAILVFRDVTDKQRLIEAVQNNQKLESLGILAGGIAHDFNNLLTGIYGYIELARMKSSQPEVIENLDQVQQSIGRARALTQQLLTFAKGGAPNKRAASVIPVLQEIPRFALSGSNVEVRFDISEDLSPCNFDRNQIAQVIDNLVINAKQAMPMGGTIFVSAKNRSFVHSDILKPGDYVEIKIRDTGTGIPEKFISHIFDPFFTTKESGHGLGLATSYSIVKRHGGTILVDSKQGEGTEFTIYLPSGLKNNAVSENYQKLKWLDEGCILIMDDEESIRKTLSLLLKTIGYKVILTRNGEEAIKAIETSEQEIKAAFLDITIPGGMGGREAIVEIRKTMPTLPVFVVSGYAEDPIMIHPEKYGFTASISKPFTFEELKRFLSGHLKNNRK